MMKRFISLFLVTIVLIGAYAPVAQAAVTPFSDVPQDAWFAEAVAWASRNGITTGVAGTTEFRPHNNVTRGEFVTFLYRVAGEPSVSLAPQFNDVGHPNRFFFRAVQWAAANGITTGFSGTNDFRPYNPITRQEIATMLHRFAQLRRDDLTAAPGVLYMFPDRNRVSGWATEGMSWATTRGIVRGNRGRLLPHDHATRAEALTMLYRHIEEVPFTLPPIAGFNHGSTVNGAFIGPPATRTENDQHIWNFFRDNGLSPQATAGIMGNLFAESGMRPNITERGRHYRIRRDMDLPGSLSAIAIDEIYTEAVNTGTYRTSQPQSRPDLAPNIIPPLDYIDSRHSFIFDGIGYGLSQWTFPTRKRDLYDFIMNRAIDIAIERAVDRAMDLDMDLDMYLYTYLYMDVDEIFNIGCLYAQLDFMWYELNEDFPTMLRDLRTITCVFEASNIVLNRFKIPGDRGPDVQGRRAGFSLGYFNRFAG